MWHGLRYDLVMSTLSAKVKLGVMMLLCLTAVTGAMVSAVPQQPAERITPITAPVQTNQLRFSDLEYSGAFRLPSYAANGDDFSFGGAPLAYHAERDSLFVGTMSGRIAEITIPGAASSATIDGLPSAEFLQGFSDPTEGRLKDVASEGARLAGLMVYQQRLYGTGIIYYDANNTQAISHFSRPLNLSDRSITPFERVGERGRLGFVAGYMAPVPAEWQSRLGGPAITGQCCVSIISRTSAGPAAFAWNPADLLRGSNDIKASPLVVYPVDHATLGPWDNSNPTYGGTTQMGGVVVIPGTQTALFIGSNGLGPFCYGNGTANKLLVGTIGSDGAAWCYDPAVSGKGQHAYPYRLQMWAYDLNELALVYAGGMEPWAVRPYAVWPFEVQFGHSNPRVGGVSYDPVRRRIFLSELEADRDGTAYRALIHVFHVS